MTPEQLRLRGQIAANTRWSREADRTAATARARAGFMARFEREVDPDNQLPAGERARRAESAMKAHMARMSLASSRRGSRSTKTKPA